MPLHIVKGHYRLKGSEPDGDSLHFYPTDRDAFTRLHLPARLRGQGTTQLRLEAINALETHYSPRVAGGFLQHQPLGLGHAAAAELLRLLDSPTCSATASGSPRPPLSRSRATS